MKIGLELEDPPVYIRGWRPEAGGQRLEARGWKPEARG